jgi:hypothetical protein
MGNAVALRLAGPRLSGGTFTRNPAKAESLKLHNAVVSPSLRDLAGRVDVIISFPEVEIARRRPPEDGTAATGTRYGGPEDLRGQA